MESQKVDGLITYSLDQQIFKIKVNSGTKQELWGVHCDFKSYQDKWTIDPILQHMGFYATTENPCVMMREKHRTQSSEYIVICQNELYIASQTPEEIVHTLMDKYMIHIYQGSNFPHDPGGTSICQIKKYVERLYANVNILFNKDNLPKDLHIVFEIIKLLIIKGNLSLILNKSTYEHIRISSKEHHEWTNLLANALDGCTCKSTIKLKIADEKNLKLCFDSTTKLARTGSAQGTESGALNR